ncbi:MAG: CoA pyrophosphatase [Parvibaculum sp.]|uniref:NUDIX hydrolase n=1 Tax=Parvibaculum sp. TaxID=2024848 RepID=UPI001B1B4DC4|nr:CoA pyrophosphatase [Parvibaculum sp.]MBO6683891.1 CoA pyrophosphatase [Parvibaculum sp.]
MTLDFGTDLRAALGERLKRFERQSLDGDGLKRAAVAVTVVPHDAGAAFLLTRRAPKLNAHGGQWALPGGRLDKGEDAMEAALRELREEVALDLGPAHVLGMLDDYPTRSGYLITPVVMWAEDKSALGELMRPDSPVFLTIPESERPVIRLLIGDDHVHAPTAAVLYQFAEVGLRGKATRVAGLEQPVFAWR